MDQFTNDNNSNFGNNNAYNNFNNINNNNLNNTNFNNANNMNNANYNNSNFNDLNNMNSANNLNNMNYNNSNLNNTNYNNVNNTNYNNMANTNNFSNMNNNIPNNFNNTNTSNGQNNKKKTGLIIFIVLIICIVVGVSLFFIIKNKSDNSGKETSGSMSQSSNDKNQTISDSTYHFVAEDYNSLTETEQDEINDKIEDIRTIPYEVDGKLLLENPEFTKYALIGGDYTDNFYKIHYNENNFLYAVAIGKSSIYFMLDSEGNFNQIELKYKNSSEAITPEWDLPNEKEYNGWVCYYDLDESEFRAYYPLTRGYYYVIYENDKLTDKKAIENFFELFTNAIQFEKSDIKLLDSMLKSDNFVTYTYFNEMNDYFKKVKLSDKLSIDLVDNVNVINWYYTSNWNSTKIEVVSKDGANKYTIRESMNLNDMQDIEDSTSSGEFVPYKYKDYDLTLIYLKAEKGSFYEKYNGALMGFIINIDSRNYSIMLDINDKSIVYKGSNDVDKQVEFLFNQFFVENK